MRSRYSSPCPPLGQKRTFSKARAMSALPPIEDILGLLASKKKGTGTMAGPLSLLAPNLW
jgi:hypothetical protein